MNFKLPSSTAIEYLHRRYAPDEDEFVRIFRHCEIVWSIAEQLINSKKLDLDTELVRVGAMLHDVGYYILKPDEDRIRHGLRGAKLLKDEGYPAEICRFAACHTGTGITKEEIIERKLPLPAHDFVAKTIEERLVMYADNFHSKSRNGSHFDSYDSAREELAKISPDKAIKFDELAEEFGKPNLHALVQHYGDEIV